MAQVSCEDCGHKFGKSARNKMKRDLCRECHEGIVELRARRKAEREHKKKNTPARAFTQARLGVRALLQEIGTLEGQLAAGVTSENLDWGHVGSMQKTESDLRELRDFLGGGE